MTEIVLLDSTVHHSLRKRSVNGYPHAFEMAFCSVVPGELDHVWANFPVVFIKDAETGDFSCVALFGLNEQENLFVTSDGTWTATYAPEALVVYPFSFSPSDEKGGVVCVLNDPEYCSDTEGEKIFDGKGKPTPFLELIKRRLGNLVAGEQEISVHIEKLIKHGALAELAVATKFKSGKTHRLEGIYTPDRNVLTALEDDAVVDLHRNGTLAFAFGCAASLAHLTGMVQRKNMILEDPIVSIDAAPPRTM